MVNLSIGASTSRSHALSLAAIFTATIFLSATLLFSVQPMFTKLVLPLLGGSPNVWNTAMVFFQAMLLGGYVYAHLLTKLAKPTIQLGVHLGLTALGLAFLPLAIDPMLQMPSGGMPTFWLIGVFAATVGLPFFALSANAPLLQSWFSRTDHRDAHDPYFLYAASNAGSLIILLAYPFLIEPVFRLGEQTFSWMLGYVLLIACLLGSGAIALRRPAPATEERSTTATTAERLSFLRVIGWIVLAFIPSSLMLGVSSSLSSNIATGPMLWILPLALYLLTFVIVFAKRPLATTARLAPLMPWVPLAGLLLIALPDLPSLLALSGGLGVTFYISLFCHAKLVEDRPDVSQLTVFYIVMSVGGVLGGIFNALVAPIIFSGVYEFAVVLFASAYVVRKGGLREMPTRAGLLRAALFFGLAMLAYFGGRPFGLPFLIAMFMSATALVVMTGELRLPTSVRVFTFLAVALLAFFGKLNANNVLYQDRSFFSALKVLSIEEEEGTKHYFQHGDTAHGIQLREPGRFEEPQLYYAPTDAIATIIDLTRERLGRPVEVSMIGLGIGATACLEREGEDWTYFEIDPKVVEIAKDPSLFSFLDRCAPNADIIVGDARRQMLDVPAGSQDVIVVDAFSSNAIPAHLVTAEAMDVYWSRIKGGEGVVFFHTSNRFADVASVAALSAEASGLAVRYVGKAGDAPRDNTYSFHASGILVGRADVLDALDGPTDLLHHFKPSPTVRPWTDDYSSIIGAMRAKRLKTATIGDSAAP